MSKNTRKGLSSDELFFKIAELFGQRSTCERGDVGCVIVKNKRIISSGCNGTLHNYSCTQLCNHQNPCENAVHAEANAIAAAAKEGIALGGTTLYCTHAPCKKCAELIIQSGISQVFYINPYRTQEGVDLLTSQNVVITKR